MLIYLAAGQPPMFVPMTQPQMPGARSRLGDVQWARSESLAWDPVDGLLFMTGGNYLSLVLGAYAYPETVGLLAQRGDLTQLMTSPAYGCPG